MSAGVAVILAFLAAFIGPYFVDWTAYRPAIEAEAARLFGVRVRVLGSAEVRLLPTPSMTLDDVRVGAVEAPIVTAEHVAAEIDLPSLLRGSVRVTGLTLNRPEFHLSIDESGDMALAPGDARPGALQPGDVALEGVTFKDGAIEIADARTGLQRRLTDVNGRLDARSLAGPYRIEGNVRFGAVPIAFTVASGIRENDSIKLKTDLTPGNGVGTFTADGVLNFGGDAPVYDGRFTAQRHAQASGEGAPSTPAAGFNRLEGTFAFDPDGLTLTGLTAGYGAGANTVALDGKAVLSISPEPRFDADLSAKQLDLDSIAGSTPDHVMTPAEAVAVIGAGLPALPLPAIPGRVRIVADSMVMAGGIVQNGELDASTAADGWSIASLKALAPGRTEFSLSGDVISGRAPRLEGRLTASSEQPGTFGAWLRGASRVPTGLQPVSLSAGFTIDATGLKVSDYALKLDADTVEGALQWRPREGDVPAGLDLSASARRLDLDRIAELGRALSSGGVGSLIAEVAGDVSLRVSADRAVVGGVNGRSVDVEAMFTGGNLDVRRLDIEDLAGARIVATGKVEAIGTAPRGTLEASITASRFDGLSALAQAMAPDAPAVVAFARAAPLLAPANLTGRFEAGAAGPATSVKLTLDGDVGGSQIEAKGSFTGTFTDWRQGLLGLSVDARGPDGAKLIGQFGVPVVPVKGAGPGEIALSLAGRPAGELKATLAADVAGSSLDLDGSLTAPGHTDSTGRFDVKLDSRDIAPAALALGWLAPGLAGALPAALSAHIETVGEKATVSQLSGSFAGTQVAGQGTVDVGPVRPRVSGSLEIASVDMVALGELALGSGAWSLTTAEDSVWPDGAFGPSLISGLDLSLALKAGKVLVGGSELDAASAKLSSNAQAIDVSEIAGRLAGGVLSGRLGVVRGERGEMTVRGGLKLAGGDLAGLVPSPGLTGRLDAAFEGDAKGRSIAGLVATLSATGTVSATGVSVPSLSPGAFAAVTREADAGTLALEDGPVSAALEQAFAAGPLAVGDLSATVTVGSGILRLTDTSVALQSGTLRGSAVLDLGRWQTDASWTLSVPAPADDEDAVPKATPSATVRYGGSIDAPMRTIDGAAFAAYLNLRAIGRESRRVEELQRQVLESQRLARERRRAEEEVARRKREAEEAARAAAEADARAKAEDELKSFRDQMQRLIDREGGGIPPLPNLGTTPAPAAPGAGATGGAPQPAQPPATIPPVPDSGAAPAAPAQSAPAPSP